MTNQPVSSRSDSPNNRRLVAFVPVLICAVTMITLQSAQAQTFQVIHAFTGGGDGANPYSGLTMNGAENFYGTTAGSDNGSVFNLRSIGSGWLLMPLINFGLSGPSMPASKVTIGPDGALYGTTFYGGLFGEDCNNYSCGTVFKLQPPSRSCGSVSCPWTLTIVYEFQPSPDGGNPWGEVVFDGAGNMYGTTAYGGTGNCSNGIESGCGVVYKLSPAGSGWTETILYNFSGNDGEQPTSGLIFDASGNLYGVTGEGGNYNGGVVYELSPSWSGGWTETVLHSLQVNDGFDPIGSLIMDASGNLYGTAQDGGPAGGGTAFELSQPGTWTFQVLYAFLGNKGTPQAPLALDSAGNLYGVGFGDAGYGNVFRLMPANGSWIKTDLHSFQGSDGLWPNGGLVLDSSGNLYGTTSNGGGGPCYEGCGVVWEITP